MKISYEELKKDKLQISNFIAIIKSFGKNRKKIYSDYIEKNNLDFPIIK